MSCATADAIVVDTEVVAALAQIAAEAGDSYGTVGEMVYAVLREAIVRGLLPDGMKLRQEALAGMIGVSRIPVRSALIQLEADGLVVFTPRRGAQVRSLTRDAVEKIFEARKLLECHALGRSMASLTPERAGRLVELAVRLDNPKPADEFRGELFDFYHELYDAAGEPVLADLIDRLRDNVGRQQVGRRMHEHQRSHRSLILPVISGDADAAMERLEAHLDDVKAAILARIP